MSKLLRTPVTLVWLLLVAATAVSLWATIDHGIDSQATMTVVIITLAVAKAYLVGMYFMELRHAPWPLRAAFDAWCVVCWASVLGIYLTS
jgi:heme/copper-type cytochrome/quinol oxidase subunit 4